MENAQHNNGTLESRKKDWFFQYFIYKMKKEDDIERNSWKGRNREEWVVGIYSTLMIKLEHLRAAGVKWSIGLLRMEDLELITSDPDESKNQKKLMIQGVIIEYKFTDRWILHFI